MPDNTILCWRNQTTVKEVSEWIKKEDLPEIADFLWNRFDERYFAPIKALPIATRNGFMAMAVSCLVIEALEAFHQGWESSDKKSQLGFCSFMDREAEFHVFKGHAQSFYKNVRCGILHQAETTGGWSTTLLPSAELFDAPMKRINADKFHEAVASVLKRYTETLAKATPSAEIWTNCTKKLSAIIRNTN